MSVGSQSFEYHRMEMHLKSAEGLSYWIVIAPPAGPAPVAGYPVIYVLDGNVWAPMVAEIICINTDFGVASHTEPAVVVGIGYPIEGPFDEDRHTHDLTTPAPAMGPIWDNALGAAAGGYHAMFDFIETVVKSDIGRAIPLALRQ